MPKKLAEILDRCGHDFHWSVMTDSQLHCLVNAWNKEMAEIKETLSTHEDTPLTKLEVKRIIDVL